MTHSVCPSLTSRSKGKPKKVTVHPNFLLIKYEYKRMNQLIMVETNDLFRFIWKDPH